MDKDKRSSLNNYIAWHWDPTSNLVNNQVFILLKYTTKAVIPASGILMTHILESPVPWCRLKIGQITDINPKKLTLSELLHHAHDE